MKFSDIFKKGYGAPAPSDLVEGGLGIDVTNKKVYSKGTDGSIFQIGLTDAEKQATLDAAQALSEYIDAQLLLRLPAGLISLWNGSVVPDGWALCDGTNGTPNLINTFIKGSNIAGKGVTGGYADAVNVSHSHTFTGTAMGNHSHNFTAGRTNTTSGSLFSGETSAAPVTTGPTAGASAGTPAGTISTSGVSGTDANLPPYYTLAYIMKLA